MTHRMAKANKAFTIKEELILSASMDICRHVLAKKIAQKPLSACTVSR